jgi:CRISPR-associated exonuclease Cas4
MQSGMTGQATQPLPNRIRRFADIVEREGLHGLHFQHVALCERRAWLHLNRIDYAHLDERMALGTALHNINRPRDSSVEGLTGLSPDRIDWTNRIVVEAKGRAGAEDAVSRQTLFYAFILWAATGTPWRAQNDILSQRRTRLVAVDEDAIDDMLTLANRLSALKRLPNPPLADKKPICASCSHRFLCGIA